DDSEYFIGLKLFNNKDESFPPSVYVNEFDLINNRIDCSSAYTDFRINEFTQGICENVIDVNSNISDSTDILVRAISSIPDGSYPLSFFSAILSAFVAAFAAYLFNVLYWKKVDKKNRLNQLVTETYNITNELEEVCGQYWLSEKNSTNQPQMEFYEFKMKSILLLLSGRKKILFKMFPKLMRENIDEIYALVEEIYDLSTGGDFESKFRITSKKRASGISRRCVKLKDKLTLLSLK
ncbi:hypothetical protein, partial [Photobacterium sanguinicancri]